MNPLVKVVIAVAALGAAAGVGALLITRKSPPPPPVVVAQGAGNRAAIAKALTPEKKAVLDKELDQLEKEQKARGKQVASLLKDKKVKSNPKLLTAAKGLASKQAEVALLTDRTARAIAKGDPRAKVYQQALGRSLAQADRATRVVQTVAQRAGLATAPKPQWMPVQGKRGLTPPQAAVIGAAVGIAATLLLLDAAYDRSRYEYWRFDHDFDVVFYEVVPTDWVVFDAYAELRSIPRAEMAFVFGHYFEVSDYAVYCEALHVETFTSAEIQHWASAEFYDESYASEPLVADWVDETELATQEHEWKIETDLDDTASYEADWQVGEADVAALEAPQPPEELEDPPEPVDERSAAEPGATPGEDPADEPPAPAKPARGEPPEDDDVQGGPESQ